MSRTISSDRLARMGLISSAVAEPLAQLHASALETNKSCLFVISRSIENEITGEKISAEFMSLLLACAQISHSAATLAQCNSRRLPRVLDALKVICQCCAEACATEDVEGAEACRAACAQTLQACASLPQPSEP